MELCKRVNAQGNTIAIRMLEYLSTAKSPVHGFEALSRDFVELCQVISPTRNWPGMKLTVCSRNYGLSKLVS